MVWYVLPSKWSDIPAVTWKVNSVHKNFLTVISPTVQDLCDREAEIFTFFNTYHDIFLLANILESWKYVHFTEN
jgi:hypothetical protein